MIWSEDSAREQQIESDLTAEQLYLASRRLLDNHIFLPARVRDIDDELLSGAKYLEEELEIIYEEFVATMNVLLLPSMTQALVDLYDEIAEIAMEIDDTPLLTIKLAATITLCERIQAEQFADHPGWNGLSTEQRAIAEDCQEEIRERGMLIENVFLDESIEDPQAEFERLYETLSAVSTRLRSVLNEAT